MTWNDAAEDAMSLDDDALIEACLGLDQGKSSQNPPMILPDWPPRAERRIMVAIDPTTAQWFQARSKKTWRGDVEHVLRAWIAAHEPTAESERPPIR
jgi:hypothetical protein